METEAGDRVSAQVKQWRDDLIDLTRRNRLLSLPRGGARSGYLQIVSPDPAGVIARLVGAERDWRFHYPPLEEVDRDDSVLAAALQSEDPDLDDKVHDDELLTDASSAKLLSAKLHTLSRKATTEFLDKGIRVLYLALGTLEWREADGADPQRSPLVLVPVALERESPRDPFRLAGTDEDAVLNPALAVKVDVEFGITLPEPEDLLDVDRVLAAVQSVVMKGHREWSVSPEVLLGAFSFHKEAMYRDLKENESQVVGHDLVRVLANDTVRSSSLAFAPPDDDDLDERVPPEEMASILDADSTQRECIAAGREGRSFVMDGPPGSGKSQTIANLIAELLANSKTVLFVSEKAAALDVVKSRLDNRGLGGYVLELHSHKATRKEVAQTLAAAAGQRLRQKSSLSAGEVAEARQKRRELSAYAAAQNEVRQPFGRSLHWAIGRVAELSDQLPTADALPVPDIDPLSLSVEDFDQIRAWATTLASAWEPVEAGDDFVWRDLADPTDALAHRTALENDIHQTRKLLGELRRLSTSAADQVGLDPPSDLAGCEAVAAVVGALVDHPDVPLLWLTRDLVPAGALLGELLQDHRRHRDLVDALDHWRLDWRAVAIDADDALQSVRAAMASLDLPSGSGSWTSGDLKRAEDFAAWLSSEGVALRQAAADLAARLGLDREDPTPGDVHSLIDIASVAARPDLPEHNWFSRSGLDNARRGLGMVKPILDNYRDLTAQLRALFNDQVFQLDIESFYSGPTDLVPDLSRWKVAGRGNRKQLQACVPEGKITDHVVAALPLVRQWRSTSTQLSDASPAAGSLLGEHYFRSFGTDLDAVERAVATAEEVLWLLGADQVPSLLSQRLARGSGEVTEIASAAENVRTRCAAWTGALSGLGTTGEQHLARPIGVVAGIATAQAARVADARRVVAQLTADPAHSLDDLAALAAQRRALAEIEARFTAKDEEARAELGPSYCGLSTDWVGLAAALSWAEAIQRLVGGPVSAEAAQAMLVAPAEQLASGLRRPSDDYRKRVAAIKALFLAEYGAQLDADLAGNFDDAEELLQSLDRTGGIETLEHLPAGALFPCGCGPRGDGGRSGRATSRPTARRRPD